MASPTDLDAILALQGFSRVYTHLDAPAGLGWPSQYPFSVRRDPTGTWRFLSNPRDYVNPAIWTGPAYHVDMSTGNDANSGLGSTDYDFSQAVQRISTAVAKLNASGAAGGRIIVRAGTYYQTNTINGNGGLAGAEPTVPCAFIGAGGRVLHLAYSGETFPTTTNATYTNTFVGGVSNPRRVLDRYVRDAYGNPTDIPNLADAAAVDAATGGGWVASSATGSALTHIRRADGLQPTIENTIVLRAIDVAGFDTCTTDLYFENFDFLGGNFGSLFIDPVATRNVVAVGCTFKFSSNSAQQLDGARIRRVQGLVLLVDCEASGTAKDGLNFHRDDATAGSMHVLTVNCRGFDNGRYGIGSTNGWTTHDDVVAIDVGGYYAGQNNGAEFHSIESTKTWALGTKVKPKAGNSGANKPGFRASDGTSTLWLEETTADMTDAPGGYGVWAGAGGGTVYTRNHRTIAGREVAESGSTISRF